MSDDQVSPPILSAAALRDLIDRQTEILKNMQADAGRQMSAIADAAAHQAQTVRIRSEIVYCSFCGKSQHEVRKLISGSPTVFVCDECTVLCAALICEPGAEARNDFAKEFIKGLGVDINWHELLTKEGFSSIVRSIEFPPEYHAAGMTILSNFSSIVRDKYANKDVRVSIQQEGLKVILVIETPDGEKEQVEQTLHNYNLVLKGEITPETFLGNEIKVLEMKQQLRIAEMQIQNRTELLEVEQRHSEHLASHNKSLQSQLQEMTTLLSIALDKPTPELELLKIVVESLTQSHNNTLSTALKIIETKIRNGVQKSDEAEIKQALMTIKKESPGILQKIYNFAEQSSINAVGNVAGTYICSWIAAINASFPH